MTRSVLLAVALTLAGARAARAEEVKLGYVDLMRAVSETEDGRKAKASLKKIFDQKQKELDEQQDDLRKAKEDLDKKRTLLSAETLRQKETELQQKLEKVQQTYLRHNQDLQGKEQEATQKIFERMQKIIARISSSENFTMVFDKNGAGVVFAKPHLDLTNELIRRYNSGEGAEGGGGSPAKAPAKAPAPGQAKGKK